MATIQASPASLPAASSSGRPRSVTLRKIRETIIVSSLICCGVFTVVVTGLILFLLIKETLVFFNAEMSDIQDQTTTVSLADFFLDLKWSPTSYGDKHFGIWPLIVGTLQVTVVAMLFALPLGLITAIWLSEYASDRVRSLVKPILEIIAGIPTVVFGYFALTVITPFLRVEWWQTPSSYGGSASNVMQAANPLNFSIYNGLSAGIAVGIMCIPIVTSLSEDALRAVPKALREGAYGLGASRFETSVKVVTPAALSGIIAAFLLAFARAVGETMTVALAAGALAVPLQNGVGSALAVNQDTQTMTGYMVMVFLGDIKHGGVEYQSCYAVAMMLFLMTLLLTLIGGFIRKRFRQTYD